MNAASRRFFIDLGADVDADINFYLNATLERFPKRSEAETEC